MHAFNLVHHLKPQFLVDSQIRHPLGTLEIARNFFVICFVRDCLDEPSSKPVSAHLRPHGNHVAKVVPPWIRPDRVMGFSLEFLPLSVASESESAPASVADIREELSE